MPSFAPYEILRALGEGGMGVVYLARHTRLDRLVALKLLSAERSEKLAPRFEREARTMARLNHPNIVGFYDSGQTPEGQLYLVMEYVEGATLAELIANPPADFDPRAIAVQVCDALAYAHGEGVVHRDLKPGNVLVDARGRVKVADFGLARLAGTTEQSEADDPQMDLAALGALMREMHSDARWDAIVNRAMQPDPSRRYASILEMRAAIDALPAAPAARSGRGRLVVAAFAVFAVIAAGAWLTRSREEVQPRSTVSPTPAPAATPKPKPKPGEWADITEDVQKQVLADSLGWVKDGLIHVTKPGTRVLESGRIFEDAALRVVMRGCMKVIVRNASPLRYVASVEPIPAGGGVKACLFQYDADLRRSTGFGALQTPLGADFDLEADHELIIAAVGNRVSCWLDGKLMHTAETKAIARGEFALGFADPPTLPGAIARIRTVEYAEVENGPGVVLSKLPFVARPIRTTPPTPPIYPAPKQWIDATDALRSQLTSWGAAEVRGEWLHVTQEQTFYVADEQPFGDVALRVTYSGPLMLGLRRSPPLHYRFQIDDRGIAELDVWNSDSSNRLGFSERKTLMGGAYDLQQEHVATAVARGGQLALWVDDKLVLEQFDDTLARGGMAVQFYGFLGKPADQQPRVKKIEYGVLDE